MSRESTDMSRRSGYRPRMLRVSHLLAGRTGGTIARAMFAVAAVFALAGLLSACGGSSDQSTESTSQPKPSAKAEALAVAARLRQGSVSESFPKGLGVTGLRKVKISAPSAGPVEALEVTVDPRRTASPATDVFAHLEVYEKPLAAVEKSRARVALIEREYGPKSVVGGTNSYCGPATLHGQKAWDCGGIYGLVYVQALVAPRGGGPPNENESRGLALGLMSAMVSFGQENGA